ncbi:MAG: DNA topoisomerase I [archaeon]|nr:DNA topoisomerase I [archaeon]
MSEGSCGERHVSLDFGRHEKNLADDACYCIENVFGIKPKINEKKSSLNISFGGKIGVVLFDEILNLGRNSKNKKIPDFVFNVSPELKLEVIKGIFEGDATVSGYSLVLNTASLVLASQLLYLFLTLGIYADFLAYTYNHKNLFGKLVRQKVYRVFIQNNEELKKLEFLFPEWKQKWSAYRKERRKFEYRNNVKEYHTAIPIAKSLLPKFSNRREKIGRISLLRLIDKIELDEGRRSFIKKMINSNLVFLKVREINEVEPSNGHVYDLSVEENENFICGIGGIFAHNSTLTKEELIDSYKNMSNHLDFGQIEAGLTRHWLDWLWGLNLTRALTLAMKNQSERGFKILSTGRVQGPTLALLLERELEIRRFISKPYWHLELHCRVDGNEIIAMHEKGQFWDRDEADRILRLCKGKDAIAKDITKRQYRQMPPYPFNTTDLQSEAYSHFKFSPSQTLDLAESLYQMGAISYPRTSSQKLPVGIGYEKILKALSSIEHYNDLCNDLLKRSKLIPHEGPKEDPAHPAIYPTSEVPELRKLTAQQRKVYDLVVRRFMATFADPAIRESINLTLVIENNNFIAIGRRNISLGWARFYSPYTTLEEQILPEVRIGQRLENLKIDMIEKWTEPPDRYSQGSIIKEMEKRNLGTRATRAEILQTLYERNYISGKSIKVTKLGEMVTNVLRDFCPRIISEELTRNFDGEMELIMQEKKKRDEVIEEAIDFLMDIINEIKRNERKMGEALLKGLMEAREEERRLGICQKCKGELRIIRSRKSGKVFVGCSSYPNCKNSYPLPQSAKITPLGRVCEKCSTPIIQVNRRGKRTFTMCLDPKCPKKSNLSNNSTFKIQGVDNA